MTKKFPKMLLLDEVDLLDLQIGKPTTEGYELVKHELTDTTRWSVCYDIIFREPGQTEGEAWSASYSRGATECQEESPWQYETEIEATLVRQVEKVVKVWVTVKG